MGLKQVFQFLGVVKYESTFIARQFVVRHMPEERLATPQEFLNVIANIFGGKVHIFPPRYLAFSKGQKEKPGASLARHASYPRIKLTQELGLFEPRRRVGQKALAKRSFDDYDVSPSPMERVA